VGVSYMEHALSEDEWRVNEVFALGESWGKSWASQELCRLLLTVFIRQPMKIFSTARLHCRSSRHEPMMPVYCTSFLYDTHNKHTRHVYSLRCGVTVALFILFASTSTTRH